MQKMYQNIIVGLSSAALLLFTSLLKVSLMWGGITASFSSFCIFGPLLGALVGLPTIIISLLFLTVFKASGVLAAMPITLITYGLPTFVAALQWRVAARIAQAQQDGDQAGLLIARFGDGALRVALPGMCMLLFVLHPHTAAVYASYWFIPMIMFALSFSRWGHNGLGSAFSVALSSTFLAHAVGSVLWAYAVPMTPATWLSLIPVVAVERLVFAAGMTLVYALVWQCKERLVAFGKTVFVSA